MSKTNRQFLVAETAIENRTNIGTNKTSSEYLKIMLSKEKNMKTQLIIAVLRTS